jgi:hypothetical protein
MHLGNWLRSLGLERYEAAFRDNAIDEEVPRDLKEDHLRELGLPLGARIKLLKAIAALPQETEIHFPAGIAVAGSPADSAERRQVTVMFSDLVGSTALSTRMDPGGSPQAHLGLSEVRNRNRPSLRRLCRKVYGRWRASLFRLSAGS